MFNNARAYNEDGSQVFNDANLLERVLQQKVRDLPSLEAELAALPPEIPSMMGDLGLGGDEDAFDEASNQFKRELMDVDDGDESRPPKRARLSKGASASITQPASMTQSGTPTTGAASGSGSGTSCSCTSTSQSRSQSQAQSQAQAGPQYQLAVASSPIEVRLRDVFETVRQRVEDGRLLSGPFVKLPTKLEFPQYYEVIRKPIEMRVIEDRLLGDKYTGLDDLMADFALMFDNACRFNEPGSLIYNVWAFNFSHFL